jgi:DNA ligase (NAD+)
VIPQVIERVDETDRRRGPPFAMPRRCPSCNTALVERGPFTICPNGFECPAQLAGRIVHFASRDALDIEGLGDETARLFVERGVVRRLPDLFEIKPDRLLELKGFAEKSAANLVAAVKRSARVELHRFLYGLGIPEVGVAVARDLARHFGSLEAIRSASVEQLQGTPGVGPIMAEQIRGFFERKRNHRILEALLDGKVTLIEPAERGSETPLENLKIVLTGTLERWSRREAKQLIESLGGRVTSSVSKATDYVVIGDDPGSKYGEAESLGVTTLNEGEFTALLRSKGVDL